jgi:hypothetical protein
MAHYACVRACVLLDACKSCCDQAEMAILSICPRGYGAAIVQSLFFNAKPSPQHRRITRFCVLEQKIWLANLRREILGTDEHFGNPVSCSHIHVPIRLIGLHAIDTSSMENTAHTSKFCTHPCCACLKSALRLAPILLPVSHYACFDSMRMMSRLWLIKCEQFCDNREDAIIKTILPELEFCKHLLSRHFSM